MFFLMSVNPLRECVTSQGLENGMQTFLFSTFLKCYGPNFKVTALLLDDLASAFNICLKLNICPPMIDTSRAVS